MFVEQLQLHWVCNIFSRAGRSQGLLYKHLRHWFIDSVSEHFPPTALRRHHAQTVRDSTSSYKINYVIVIQNFLNPKGHRNPFSGSTIMAILLKRWILSIGGASAGEGLPCSLRSRLVFVCPIYRSSSNDNKSVLWSVQSKIFIYPICYGEKHNTFFMLYQLGNLLGSRQNLSCFNAF